MAGRAGRLTASTVGPPKDSVRTATGHCRGVPVPVEALASAAGTGYVWSTGQDLARWSHFLHEGLLQSDLHALLVTPHVEIPADNEQRVAPAYGYGLFLGELAGQSAWFHPGDNPGFSAFAGHVPDGVISIGLVSGEQDTDVTRMADDVVRALSA